MASIIKQYPGLMPGDYLEIGTPQRITAQLPDGVAVRTFVTPSLTDPEAGYMLQAVKTRKAGWGNGSANIICTCTDCAFKFGLVLTGVKTPCKHAKGLRALLRTTSEISRLDE
jgi:hypothetical protein